MNIYEACVKLGWDPEDDIVIDIAGSSTYGIEGLGTKWSPVKGTVKYNKDAFIVIKNKSRDDTLPVKSNNNSDHAKP